MKQRLACHVNLIVVALVVILTLLTSLLLNVLTETTMAKQVDSDKNYDEAFFIQETPRAFHLPWTSDIAWHFTGGPHPSDPPKNSVRDALDFAPDDDADHTVRAADAGTVVGVNQISGTLWIEHEDGWRTFYGHLAAITPTVGITVTVGQPVGIAGDTGADSVHLHFGVAKDGAWQPITSTTLEGWSIHAADNPYYGYLAREGIRIDACIGCGDTNLVSGYFASGEPVPTRPIVQHDQSFDVTIEVTNTGVVTWTEAQQVRLGLLTWDDQMGAELRYSLDPDEIVAPGQTRQWTISMVAPTQPDRYTQVWRMVREDGEIGWFGERITLTVEVRTYFTDVSDEAGLGSGRHSAAWADFDRDGLPDLFVGDRLYWNQGDGTFLVLTETMRLGGGDAGSLEDTPGGGTWGDYDNDGDVDLYIGRCKSWQGDQGLPNVLYQNNAGTEVPLLDVTAVAAVGDGRCFDGGLAWADYDNDGDLDLFVTNVRRGDILYQNQGDGQFKDITFQTGLSAATTGRSAAWADYDRDGDLDLFVGGSTGDVSHFFQNNGDGTFTEVTSQAGVGDSSSSFGIAWGDYDNDGFPDIYLSKNGANRLYHNNGDGTFTNVASAAGVADTGFGETASWGDYNNDGFLDLFLTRWQTSNRLYENNGDGTFTDVASLVNVRDGYYSIATAWADYDGDGDLDLDVALRDDNILFRNEGTSGNYLALRLIGVISNRDAIGANVTIETQEGMSQTREVAAGHGRSSQNALPLHFGLGEYTGLVTATIRWPGGQTQVEVINTTNQEVTIYERLPGHDLGLHSILSPRSEVPLQVPSSPQAKIWNRGTASEASFEVTCKALLDGVEVYHDTKVVDHLTSLMDTVVTFDSWIPQIEGIYTFTFTVNLVGDEKPANNHRTATVVVTPLRADLYGRDNWSDNGSVPTRNWWYSPDVWIRHDDDGGTLHQDPIAGVTNTVYVRVHNIGNVAISEGEVQVFSQSPSLAILCNRWQPVGLAAIPTLQPDESAIVSVPWIPNRTGHTCLLGRISAEQDPVSHDCDVPWDNNLIQRNVHVVLQASTVQNVFGITQETFSFELANVLRRDASVDLVVRLNHAPSTVHLALTLPEDLFDRWMTTTGGSLEGAEIISDTTQIRIVGESRGTVLALPLQPEETFQITGTLSGPADRLFTVDILGRIDGQIIGGNTYTNHWPQFHLYLSLILK